MKMPKLYFVAFVALAFVAIPAASAQSKTHPPSDAEHKVLNKYRDVIHSILDTFDSSDWETNSDYDIDDDVRVSMDPDVPLDADELIQRTYTVKKDSPLYQREVAPYIAKMDSAQGNPTEMIRIGLQMKRLRLEVQVHFNRASATNGKSHPQLQVPGAAQAFVSEESDDKRSQTVILLFGDWKSAVPHDDDLRFHFKHPARTPAIENVEFQLQGSPDRIRELLHSVDWKHVNDSLNLAN